MSSLKVRYHYIDVLRALAICFVVYGHNAHDFRVFFIFTSPIKMPLFFILSGMLFNARNGDIKTYLAGVWEKLVVPWILLSLIYVIPQFTKVILSHCPNAIITIIVDVVVGKRLWFMPCFIFGYIIHFFIVKYAKSKPIGLLVSLCLFFVGMLLKQYGIFDIFMINRAIHVQLFFYMGHLLKDHISQLPTIKPIILGIGVTLYIVGCICAFHFYPNGRCDVHTITYYNVLMCLALVVIGNFTLIFIMSRIKVFPAWLTFIGRNSLPIYVLQSYGLFVANAIAKVLCLDVSTVSYPLLALYKTIVIILVGSILSILINKYAPIITGGRK